jgi:hypothetical protein
MRKSDIRRVEEGVNNPAIKNEETRKGKEGGYGMSLRYRFLVLLCISFISFGSYFSYDAISALEEPLENVRLSISCNENKQFRPFISSV